VLHEVAEHVAQLVEEDLSRLLPPPMPKEEKIFCISLLPQPEQETDFSFPIETRLSKCLPHFLQINSYIGMRLFYTILFTRSILLRFASEASLLLWRRENLGHKFFILQPQLQSRF
jgi:hypothetical protein